MLNYRGCIVKLADTVIYFVVEYTVLKIASCQCEYKGQEQLIVSRDVRLWKFTV
jgi:RecB family endonuclease NucS